MNAGHFLLVPIGQSCLAKIAVVERKSIEVEASMSNVHDSKVNLKDKERQKRHRNTQAMATSDQARIPITIITGFAGSGKTTLILNLIPQLRSQNPGYRVALIKNEVGDVAVDTQLAAAAEMTGTQELLGDCICCTNVGQIGDALATLDRDSNPDRIIIETSGSAEPLKLVLEVNRLAKETGRYELDGIVSVIDAENWCVSGLRLQYRTLMLTCIQGRLCQHIIHSQATSAANRPHRHQQMGKPGRARL